MIPKGVGGVGYGDLLMLLNNETRAYEKNEGESTALVEKWVEKLSDDFAHGKSLTNPAIKKNMKQIIAEFAAIPRINRKAIKVGVVGEIFVKYSPLANNDLEDFLVSQVC